MTTYHRGLPSIVGGACWRLRPRQYELRATYRGGGVQLLRTADAPVFGQVKRVLIRVLEADRRW